NRSVAPPPRRGASRRRATARPADSRSGDRSVGGSSPVVTTTGFFAATGATLSQSGDSGAGLAAPGLRARSRAGQDAMSALAEHQGDDYGTASDRRGTAQRFATYRQTGGRGMKTIVALPGEGIGPEVVDATLEVLAGTGLPLKILTPPQGRDAVKSHG